MMSQTVCISNFEILPSFFHFLFAVLLFDVIMICAVSNRWLLLGNGWAYAVCVLYTWCMRGTKGAWKTSKHPINFWLSSCVCMFWQETTSSHNEAVVHGRVECLTKDTHAPRQPLLHPTIHLSSDFTNIVLHTRVHLIVFLAETKIQPNGLHRGWSFLNFPVPIV